MGAELAGDAALDAFQNIKVRLVSPAEELVEGDLYAKVMIGGLPLHASVHAVSPMVARYIAARCEPQPSEPAEPAATPPDDKPPTKP